MIVHHAIRAGSIRLSWQHVWLYHLCGQDICLYFVTHLCYVAILVAMCKIMVNQFSFCISIVASGDFICTWSGQLPPRQHRNPTYSTRIFVGGVPWDITEAGLMQAFRPFGSLNIEWPGKEGKHCRHPPKGKLFITQCMVIRDK